MYKKVKITTLEFGLVLHVYSADPCKNLAV